MGFAADFVVFAEIVNVVLLLTMVVEQRVVAVAAVEERVVAVAAVVYVAADMGFAVAADVYLLVLAKTATVVSVVSMSCFC